MKQTKVILANRPLPTYKEDAIESDTVTVTTKSWYQKPVVWIAIITALTGVAGVIAQVYPDISEIAILVSVLQIILNTYETVVSNGSVVGDITQ